MDIDRRLHVIEVLLGDILRTNFLLLKQQEKIMIDTSQALASVQRLQGKVQSMEGLLKVIHDHLVTVSQQLAQAIQNADPAAQARVQADLNQIASLADTASSEVDAAISANPDVQDQQQGGATQAPPADQTAPASPAQPINQTQNPS